MGDLGYAGEEALKLLGVDWSGADTIRHDHAAKRIAKCAKAVRNLVAMAPAGVHKMNIARAHVIGASRYGVSTMGLPPKLLARVRTILRSATCTRARGGSATTDLAVQAGKDIGPAYMVVKTPIAK